MSIKDWPGGYIKPVPPTPAGPYEDGAADGVWTLDQVAYWIKQGLWPTAGVRKYFIEDVFSTYIYSGNGTTQTITNNINVSGDGALVWIKDRTNAYANVLVDTNRGASQLLSSNDTGGQSTYGGVTAFTSSGFTVSTAGGTLNATNASGDNYVSWTFEQAPKFFDVVTYTGNGVAGRAISHNLGSAPGCIIFKNLTQSTNWGVYHRSIANTKSLYLNLTDAETTSSAFNNSTATSTEFYVGTSVNTNNNGDSYVAYLFAHDAGGFGDDGSQNVISCGSFTTDSGGNFSVSLGYEPQFVMIKRTDAAQNWFISDIMRGFSNSQFNTLNPNLSDAEGTNTSNYVAPDASGFKSIGNQFFSGSATYIYIAIRRGPMRTPTTGTSVYEAYYDTSNIANQTNGSLPAVDFVMQTQAPTPLGGYNWTTFDRLRGNDKYLLTDSANGEATASSVSFTAGQLGEKNATWFSAGGVGYNIKRAPGFFDVVCYSGTGSATTQTHNLGVAPELMIVKRRDTTSATGWIVYAAPLANAATSYLVLNLTDAVGTGNTVLWNSTAPTSSVFSLGTSSNINASGSTNVAYLFATLAGVSKVGSYTGNGSNQTINCGFTTGARFVMIKRTDSTSNWVVFDYARGIVAGNDPYLTLNTTNAQVSTQDAVDTDNTGFVVNETTGPNINTNGASYIFLAIS